MFIKFELLKVLKKKTPSTNSLSLISFVNCNKESTSTKGALPIPFLTCSSVKTTIPYQMNKKNKKKGCPLSLSLSLSIYIYIYMLPSSLYNPF